MRNLRAGRKSILRALGRAVRLAFVAGCVLVVPTITDDLPALASQRKKDRQDATSGSGNQNGGRATANANKTNGTTTRQRRQPGSAIGPKDVRRHPRTPRRPDIYRVRVILLDPQRRPVDDANIWSTYGGEKMRVEGGLLFQIPAASIPASGRLKLYATKDSAFLSGEGEIQLGSDPNPAVTIELTRPTKDVFVRGIVIDESNNAVSGVRVSVVGFESEAVTTKADGGFVLPAHAAVGQQVMLHAEKPGHKAVNQYHPAGDEQATIILERK